MALVMRGTFRLLLFGAEIFHLKPHVNIKVAQEEKSHRFSADTLNLCIVGHSWRVGLV